MRRLVGLEQIVSALQFSYLQVADSPWLVSDWTLLAIDAFGRAMTACGFLSIALEL